MWKWIKRIGILLSCLASVLVILGFILGYFPECGSSPVPAPAPAPAPEPEQEPVPAPAPPTVDLSGLVMVQFSREPVDNAEVTIRLLEDIHTKKDYSRSTGAYIFKSLPCGTYDFKVTKDGCIPNPYTDIIPVESDTVYDVYLLSEKVFEQATLSPGLFVSLPDWAEISTGLDIEVTSLTSPQVKTLYLEDIEQEIVFMNLAIQNVGYDTVYLDLREAYLSLQSPTPPYSITQLNYDLASSLFEPYSLQSLILKLEPYQEPVVASVAFVPSEGEKLPPQLGSVVPTFWAFRETAPLELIRVSPDEFAPPGIWRYFE